MQYLKGGKCRAIQVIQTMGNEAGISGAAISESGTA